MKAYLLVFDDGSNPDIDLKKYLNSLDANAEIFTLDGHVCFLKSSLSVAELSARWLQVAGSSLFFITAVTSSEFEGRMPAVFWDFLKQPRLEAAAE